MITLYLKGIFVSQVEEMESSLLRYTLIVDTFIDNSIMALIVIIIIGLVCYFISKKLFTIIEFVSNVSNVINTTHKN